MPVRHGVSNDEFGHCGDAEAGDQGGQDGVPVVDLQAPGWTDRDGVARWVGEVPGVAGAQVGIAEAIVLREVGRMRGPAAAIQVGWDATTTPGTGARAAGQERGIR